MHKLFFDDLFMMFGGYSGKNATGFDTPPLDRKLLGKQWDDVLFYPWSRRCIAEFVMRVSSRHGCLQGIAQCRRWVVIRIFRCKPVGWRSPALHLARRW